MNHTNYRAHLKARAMGILDASRSMANVARLRQEASSVLLNVGLTHADYLRSAETTIARLEREVEERLVT